jgi:hypothetical protein
MKSLLPSLEEEINSSISSFGLQSGLSKYVMIMFSISRYLDDPVLKNKGFQLMEAISANLSLKTSISLKDGLPEIGWTVEWLKQYKFLKCNTDLILEDIDDIIYKVVINSAFDETDIIENILSCGVYYLKRYKSENPRSSWLKKIYIPQCLFILSTDLVSVLNNEFLSKNDLTVSKGIFIKIANAVNFISDLYLVNINENVIETCLYEIIEKVQPLFARLPRKEMHEYNEDLCFLLFSLLVTCDKLKYYIGKGQIERALNQLLNIETESFYFKKIIIWTLICQKIEDELIKSSISTKLIENMFEMKTAKTSDVFLHFIIENKLFDIEWHEIVFLRGLNFVN